MKSSLITTEAFGTGFAILIGKALPPWLGYPVARLIARIISLFPGGSVYQALGLNQWILSGKKMSERDLRRTIRKVLENQGRALYDFYHSLDRPEEIRRLVSLTPKFIERVDEFNRQNRATLLLIPHLAGLNLGGLRLVQEQLHYLTLSYPHPSKGYAWENKLRNERGMEVVPMTVTALRQARERLQGAGAVLTGIDRPLEGSTYHPRFFGYPSALPVSHIRLALKTNARVFVVGFLTLPDHTYSIDISDEIYLEHSTDPIIELEGNAEKVLQAAETYIRYDPLQWVMFYPVWPDQMVEFNQARRM